MNNPLIFFLAFCLLIFTPEPVISSYGPQWYDPDPSANNITIWEILTLLITFVVGYFILFLMNEYMEEGPKYIAIPLKIVFWSIGIGFVIFIGFAAYGAFLKGKYILGIFLSIWAAYPLKLIYDDYF